MTRYWDNHAAKRSRTYCELTELKSGKVLLTNLRDGMSWMPKSDKLYYTVSALTGNDVITLDQMCIRDRVAIIAPSILGQFKTSIEQVYGAFKEIGFTDIIEVAEGAMMTTSNEAHELLEKLEEGQKFMTTSCCPSYIELVEKHMTEMKPYVSTTGSPMYYAARIAKEKHPDAKIVFVGPCVAKRKEVRRDDAVDYILTFEEVGSILDGMDIQLEQVNSFSILHTSVREAHGFAQAGGVMGAVKAYLKEEDVYKRQRLP